MITLFRRIRQKLIESGSVTKYLLYAVGEILLVVIGILIALQVNNWNEERKKNNAVENYTRSLISDLATDSTAIAETVKIMEREIDLFKEFQSRLTAPTATIDTLYHIFEEEFPVLTTTLGPFSDNTFNVLTSTGDIGLFPDSLSNRLFSLNRMQKDYLENKVNSWDNFRVGVMNLAYNFPLPQSFSMINEGPLYERTLKLNEDEFIVQFNSVALAKQNVYRQVTRDLRIVSEHTNDLLKILREINSSQ